MDLTFAGINLGMNNGPFIWYGLWAVIIVSLISFVGASIVFAAKNKGAKYIPFLVSLAAGALLGDALLHLLPEALSGAKPLYIGLATLVGFLIFYILEHILHWHHSHDGDEEHHSHGRHIGGMITAADAIHNFIDGIIIALGFLINVETGIATTLAVILHEIPQEIGDMGLLLYAGWSKAKAMTVNFLSACTSILGFMLVYVFGGYSNSLYQVLPYMLAIAAGSFIYIALVDLIPEMFIEAKKQDKSSFFRHICMIGIGFLVMVILLAFE